MSELDDLVFVPERFSGKVRLFPLPNLVMFPHVMQPLHVFEPRYKELIEDAIAGDHLVAMARLAPGWEKDYEGRPPLAPMACLGRVVTYQLVPPDRYNVLLMGLRRVRLIRELAPTRSFREAEVEVYEDEYPDETAAVRPALQKKLVRTFRKILPQLDDVREQLDQLLGTNVSLGMLTDIVAYALDLDLEVKQQLLGQRDADRRALLLLDQLGRAGYDTSQHRAKAGFPPEFSAN
jgi:ATP-dependent Lon protease